jgi:hypothetical protein
MWPKHVANTNENMDKRHFNQQAIKVLHLQSCIKHVQQMLNYCNWMLKYSILSSYVLSKEDPVENTFFNNLKFVEVVGTEHKEIMAERLLTQFM